jgi:hypothetical protein
MKIKILTLLLVLATMMSASAAPKLSGNYKGTVAYTPSDGVTTYQDGAATLKIQGAVAVVTYSDQLGHYREKCSITYNSDGTVTLQGISYKLLAGSSFNLDTFTIKIAQDGSLSGTSVDTDGGHSKLSFHH